MTIDEKWSSYLARALCAAITFAFLAAAPLLAERLPVKTYTTADGLQRDNVYRIRIDSRGFLWLCTAEGVSRFDGVGMTNFTIADGLPNRFVQDVLETSSGTIYVATGRGLARLNPHGLRASKENPLFTVFRPDNAKAERITTLYEDKHSRVWIGTSDGLYKLIETRGRVEFEPLPLGEPTSGGDYDVRTTYVTAILADRRGTLWVGTQGQGLVRLSPDGNVRHITLADGLGGNLIAALLEMRDGRLWAGMRTGERAALCLLDAENAKTPVKKCYAEKDGVPSTWIFDLLETSDGKFWLAAGGGLCWWQGEGGASVCKTYTKKNDLCESALALAEDRDGNLWMGSGCGATKIARYGFTAYYEADGLGWEKVNSVFENSNGELFASANRTGRVVSRFDGDKFSLIKPLVPDYVNWNGWGWQQTVWQDSRGAWWIPTGRGLFRSPDNTSFENLARVPLELVETGLKVETSESHKRSLIEKYGAAKVAEMKFYEVFRLFEDSRGDIWIGVTNEKLLRWERAANLWHDYTQQAGLSKVRLVSAFAEDRDGNVWIGTGSDDAREINEGLLLRYRAGRFQRFTHAEGSPTGWIRDLFLDSKGRLWMASTNDGVRRIDDTNADVLNFTSYTPASGLTSLSTASITEDAYGRIYIGTWRGIDRLTPETGQVENFTSADGLPGGYVESSYRDRRNNLWFVTDKGLARFIPEPVHPRKPPTILVTGLRVNGTPQSVSILGESSLPALDLNSEQRQITVDFIGLGASLGEKLKYEYRFGNSEWTSTSERTLNFANLGAGNYRFEVRAQTADRIYSTSPATFSFKIAPPIWQRWWFLGLAFVLLAGLIYLLYRYRLRQLLEVEKVRTRIATDLHDDIGASLTKIAILSEVARQQSSNGDDADSPLGSIARISRESVASMSDIVWAINPDRDRLVDLVRRMRLHAEEIFMARDIELEFRAPDAEQQLKLGVNVRRDLFLIFKEAVNNAARHSQCSRVVIELQLEGPSLSLEVADNGQGFDLSTEKDGHGLSSMTRRAQSLGGTINVRSTTGTGTTLKLRIPYSRANLIGNATSTRR